MTVIEVRNQVMEICKQKLGVNFSSVELEYDNTPVFGNPFNFDPYMLLFLTLELQKVFDIQFSKDQLLGYNLLDVNGIINAILENMEVTK